MSFIHWHFEQCSEQIGVTCKSRIFWFVWESYEMYNYILWADHVAVKYWATCYTYTHTHNFSTTVYMKLVLLILSN